MLWVAHSGLTVVGLPISKRAMSERPAVSIRLSETLELVLGMFSELDSSDQSGRIIPDHLGCGPNLNPRYSCPSWSPVYWQPSDRLDPDQQEKSLQALGRALSQESMGTWRASDGHGRLNQDKKPKIPVPHV